MYQSPDGAKVLQVKEIRMNIRIQNRISPLTGRKSCKSNKYLGYGRLEFTGISPLTGRKSCKLIMKKLNNMELVYQSPDGAKVLQAKLIGIGAAGNKAAYQSPDGAKVLQVAFYQPRILLYIVSVP